MTTPSIAPEAFRAFEHEGWQKVSQRYHHAFASLTSQAVVPLLDAAEVSAGVRVLDVAAGPGYVAGVAADRGAEVIGIDFSQAMVAAARRHYPKGDFREGDAEDLPFGAAVFDAVVMNFGLLHLGRPEWALAEAHRVLRPGGKYAFTVWARPEEAIGFEIVLNAIHAHGKVDVGLPQGPSFSVSAMRVSAIVRCWRRVSFLRRWILFHKRGGLARPTSCSKICWRARCGPQACCAPKRLRPAIRFAHLFIKLC